MTSRRGALAGGVALAAALGPFVAARAETRAITSEDGRSIRLTTWAPAGPERGVILFSHGALSAPERYQPLIGAWTLAGFRVLAPLHVDSTDHPEHAKYGMLDSWRTRLLDMRAVSAVAEAPTYVVAGHSYGALVALALGGAVVTPPPGLTGPTRDARARAVVAFSPPGRPSPSMVPADGYGGLAVPAFIETGDKDIPFGVMGGDWRVHLSAYEAAPPGDKYALVLEGADHYFGGLICRLDLPGPPQTQAMAKAAALSTDFILGFGADDKTARESLDAALTPKPGFSLKRK